MAKEARRRQPDKPVISWRKDALKMTLLIGRWHYSSQSPFQFFIPFPLKASSIRIHYNVTFRGSLLQNNFLLHTYLTMWLVSAKWRAMMPHLSISGMDNGVLDSRSCSPCLRRGSCSQDTGQDCGNGTPMNRQMCENQCFSSHWSVGIAIGKLSNTDFHEEYSPWWGDYSHRVFVVVVVY